MQSLPIKLSKPCVSHHNSVWVAEDCHTERRSENIPNWASLPDGVWWTVFGFLDSSSLSKCLFVSKRWHIVSSDDRLWKALTWNDW